MDGMPDNRRITRKLGSPQRMADQNDAGSSIFFVGGEAPSKFWMNAECRQQVPRNDFGIYLDRTLQARQRKHVVVIGNQVIERVVLRAPVEEIRIRNGSGMRIARVDGFGFNQA